MARKCFVIMPFQTKFNDIYETIISPTVKSIGDNCVRTDDLFTVGSILEDIFKLITTAEYVIADLSLINANVYYELGYAHALEKKVILLTQNIDTLPFDLQHQRVIKYEDSAKGAKMLELNLKKFIQNL